MSDDATLIRVNGLRLWPASDEHRAEERLLADDAAQVAGRVGALDPVADLGVVPAADEGQGGGPVELDRPALRDRAARPARRRPGTG